MAYIIDLNRYNNTTVFSVSTVILTLFVISTAGRNLCYERMSAARIYAIILPLLRAEDFYPQGITSNYSE